MKSKFIALLFTATVLLPGLSSANAADGATEARVIKIRAGVDNAMKYDVTSIPMAPGETVKIVLTNASTLPKAVMGHNWVLLVAGTDVAAFAAAAATEAANEYIPAKLKEKIIAATKLLGPNEVAEVTFKAPSAPGDYPFICTFPAHSQIGFKGVVVVKK